MIYLVISFCQPNGKMPTLVKASHHLSKAFPTCGVSLPMEKILWERSVWKHLTTMFEGGNLLNMNLTPVTNIPCNFMSCVAQLQSHLCQHQSDLLLHFWGNCVNLHLPTTIGKHTQHVCASQHAQHVHTQKIGRSCLKFVIVSAWS